jgi:hypothetical protein
VTAIIGAPVGNLLQPLKLLFMFALVIAFLHTLLRLLRPTQQRVNQQYCRTKLQVQPKEQHSANTRN